MLKPAFVFFLCFILAGCAPYGPEELERLTKEDPRFKQMIVARDQVHAQVHAIKDELLARKKAMDAQIDKFRKEYDATAKTANLKIEKYQLAIDANRSTLLHEMEAAGAALGARITELDGYQKTITDVKKVLQESKGIHISGEEKQKWEERLLLLSEKVRPLSEEIQELQLRIRLLKRKIGFLK